MTTSVVVLGVLGLLAGCATGTGSGTSDARPAERKRVEQRLAEVFDAAEKKDLPRLDRYHLYGPGFTKFSGSPAGRQDAETARAGEHAAIAASEDASMRAEDLKIDLFGETAIATFVLDYRFRAGAERQQRKARGTLVFVRDRGEWKIVHEHFSPVPASP